jgi:hypothetical protein
MKNKRTIIIVSLILVMLCCLCLICALFSPSLFGSNSGLAGLSFTSGNTPEEMFRYTVSDPIPEEVLSIAGAGDTWQGHNLHLIIKYSQDSYIEKFLARHNYEAVVCSTIDIYLRPDASSLVKLPGWQEQMTKVSGAECYKAIGISNSWTSYGSSHALIDGDSKTIFLNETGI